MKINPIVNPNIARSYQANGARSAALASNPQQPKRDEVTFSAEALNFSKSLQAARESLPTRSPEETSRISAIKAAVQNGEYKVSSEDIADRILASVFGAN